MEAIRVCSEVLQAEPDNVNALKDRAEAYLVEEMYDEGQCAGGGLLSVWELLCMKTSTWLKSCCSEQVYQTPGNADNFRKMAGTSELFFLRRT